MPAIVPACVRTLAIFELFAQEKEELSNSQVARALGIAETSSLDLLYTLVNQGYLIRTPSTRRFYPTRKFLVLSKKIASNDPLTPLANEIVEKLVQRTAETALCGRIEKGAVEVVALREGKHELRYIQRVGRRIALHASALGKALLSLLSEDEIREHLAVKGLKQITSNSCVDLDKMLLEIQEVSRRGWSSTFDEGVEGVGAFAVAGFIGSEPTAFSLAGLSGRLRRNEKEYLDALLDIKGKIFDESNDVENN